MPTLHLISGLPCSGKTTHANALTADSPTVLFTLDRWLIRAFGKYSLETLDRAMQQINESAVLSLRGRPRMERFYLDRSSIGRASIATDHLSKLVRVIDALS